MQIDKNLSQALKVVALSRPGVTEQYLSAQTIGADDLAVFRDFPPTPAEILSLYVFGGCGFYKEAMALMGEVRWPVTWVHGDGCTGEHLAGVQAFAVSGPAVRDVELDGRVVGRAYADEDAEYCHLGGILPADVSRPRPEQARSALEKMEEALSLAGMDFSHVVRTWIYLADILDWYTEFNEVRTAFYCERHVFDGVVPASTGIGAANPAGAAVVAGAFAVRPKHDDVHLAAVPSPVQCPATDYKSSFSRAVELSLPGRRQLYLSGTASIDRHGETAHRGRVCKQIELTMAVCEAILSSRQMNWQDASRMVAYFKDMRDAPHLTAYCRGRGLPELPVALAHAAVCRDDLLFEVEMDAIALNS